MAKYNKRNQVSDEVVDESMKMARGTQKPGQTKEQTKLIAQGIQKGIELYKKQHKAKTRELDKRRKKRLAHIDQQSLPDDELVPKRDGVSWLPWLLLIISWLSFAIFEWLMA
jgi:Protein of unknown function (DUF2956)